MLRKTELFVILPIVTIMVAAGLGYYLVARDEAEEAAERRLTASAQSTSELVASRIKSLDSILQATLTQESLSNYLMYRGAGLLDDAERERHEIEQSLLKVSAQDGAIVACSLFDHEGNRFVGVVQGHRTMRPLSALARTPLYAQADMITCSRFGGPNQVVVWRALREPTTGRPIAVASVAYKLDQLAGEAASFVDRHLDHYQVRLLDSQGIVRYRKGPLQQTAGCITAAAPLPALQGKVQIVHDEQQALSAFYHSQSMLFLALGGVTLLLIVMTSLGTWYVTGELRRNTEVLQRQREQLKLSTQQAEAASEAKTNFLANMSHEIRTPMTAILGFAELLKSDDLSEAEARDCLETVLRNGQHLLSLINQILDLTKIESGKLEIELAECSPAEVIGDVEQLFQSQADAKGIELICEWRGPVPERIVTDPTRLKQALMNLLCNAIKFTESGQVRLLAQCDDGGDQMVIEVRDTGIGMTEAHLERIFHPFLQADNSTTRNYGGTGLGLSITKQIVSALGGTIAVESVPGVGTSFHVRIPLGSVVARGRSVGEAPACPEETSPLPCSPSFGSMGRVLIVEDGSDNQRLLTRVLNRAEVATEVAENGKLGVEAACEAQQAGEPFDLILMDLHMPVMDGYSATEQIRAAGYQGQIVALTANALKSDLQRCLANGFDGYITKPIDRHRFVKEVLRRIEVTRQGAGFAGGLCGEMALGGAVVE